MRTPVWLLAVASIVGCGGDEDGGATDSDAALTDAADTDDNPDAGCSDAPSDAPAADAITAGGAGVICYYGPPEGYCRDVRSATAAQQVEGGDEGAIGCADAIVVTDGSCPVDRLVGRCLDWSAEETRSYYECNQYDALFAGGPREACESVGGTWEAP